jgi:hypothetical protein
MACLAFDATYYVDQTPAIAISFLQNHYMQSEFSHRLRSLPTGPDRMLGINDDFDFGIVGKVSFI